MYSIRQARFEADLLKLPLFLEGVCAGFPSPADDHIDQSIDLQTLLVRNPPATFIMRVDGHSMKDLGIFDRDLLIIDRSLTARHGDVVVAIVDGERSIKRLVHRPPRLPSLVLANKEFPPYSVAVDSQVEIWGVVVCNLHWLRGRR